MEMLHFVVSFVLMYRTVFIFGSCAAHKAPLENLAHIAFRSAHFFKNISTSNSGGSGEDLPLSKVCNGNAHHRKPFPSLKQKSKTTNYVLPPEYSHLSEEFINCGRLSFPPECYIKLDNESVFVTSYDKVLNKSNYLITDGILYICQNPFARLSMPKFRETKTEQPNVYTSHEEEYEFPPSIHIMTTICITISAVCIILHTILFVCIKRMQNLPGCCLLCLCLALLIGYISSYVMELQLLLLHDCKIAGMVLYYGFLSSFCWMNVMSYDVWTAIKMAVDKLRLSSTRSFLKRFLRYSAYGWILPLLIFVIACIVNQTTSNVEFKFTFSPDYCWFHHKYALDIYFILPICLLLILNICLFVSTYRMFRKTTEVQETSDIMPHFFLCMRLASIMGIMWIIGIVSAFIEVQWLWYLHSVCNDLQGLYIFFSFDVNEKTWKDCKSVFRKRKTSEMPLNDRKKSYGNANNSLDERKKSYGNSNF